MPVDYFSDRLQGPTPTGSTEITKPVWGGIVALVERGLALPWFAKDFPLICDDGGAVCGCDSRAFGLAVNAEIPDLGWPAHPASPPPTLAALDLLEFAYRHASSARERSHHRFYDHPHFVFDAAEGRREVRHEINRLLARSGMAYELDDEGRIEHRASAALEEQLRIDLPPTIDQKFDELVQSAIDDFRSPDLRDRRQGLATLWDAFERSKTILHGDKRKGAQALIAASTDGVDPSEVEFLDGEMRELTRIGNTFRIRHHETNAAELSDEMVEQLFARMYAMLVRVHGGLCEP